MRIGSLVLAGVVALAGCSKSSSNEASKEPSSKTPSSAAGAAADAKPVTVVVDTSMGAFKLRLDPAKAPETVQNFLQYVDDRHYDGTIFHRVISTFMIQGGGFTPELNEKPTRAPIKNEAGNGLKNRRGTVAMARTMIPDSATSQFYVNVVDNPFLDFRDPSPNGIGYAVFGEVVEGMDVVDRIKNVPTGRQKGMSDVPNDPVIIKSIRRE